ncbi:hypothetical protein H4Q26_006030 [Puccinia striiformis f. sp. tritici PST-130]|nr:hypothetical protein H4Q26_006030 [Puccinia striiformis f. sp. tritici PST-130]
MASSQIPISPAATSVPKSASTVPQASVPPQPTTTIAPTTPSPVPSQSGPLSSARDSSVSYSPLTYSTIASAPQPTTAPQLPVTPAAKLAEPMVSSVLLPIPIKPTEALIADNAPLKEGSRMGSTAYVLLFTAWAGWATSLLTYSIVPHSQLATPTIPTQKMENSQHMGTPDANYRDLGQQETDVRSSLPHMTLIAIIAAIACASLFMGISIWSCHRKRNRRRAARDSLPYASNYPMRKDPTSPEKDISLAKSDSSNSPPRSSFADTTPHSKFCEEFQYGLPVVSPVPKMSVVPKMGAPMGSYNVNGRHESPPTMRGGAQLDRLPNCPEHLTFVPKILLTGNLLYPQQAFTPPGKALGFNDTILIKTLPAPRSCGMSPAEASKELQKLIEQVDLRIYEDLDMDDSYSDSIDSSTPESFSALTGDFLPSGNQLFMMNRSVPNLPLPLPRYNYRKITRLQQSPQIV